jgi:hypothetical protein
MVPLSIITAKVKPGWVSAAAMTSCVARSMEVPEPYQSMMTPAMPRLTMSLIWLLTWVASSEL